MGLKSTQEPKAHTQINIKKPNLPFTLITSQNQEKLCKKKMAEKPQPVKVNYCGVCGLPAEYCEFGPDFEKCKPWLIRNAPDVYPDLIKGIKNNPSLFCIYLYLQMFCVCVFMLCFVFLMMGLLQMLRMLIM